MNPLIALMKTRFSTVMTAKGHSANLITSAEVRAVRGSSCRNNTGARYTESRCDGVAGPVRRAETPGSAPRSGRAGAAVAGQFRLREIGVGGLLRAPGMREHRMTPALPAHGGVPGTGDAERAGDRGRRTAHHRIGHP